MSDKKVVNMNTNQLASTSKVDGFKRSTSRRKIPSIVNVNSTVLEPFGKNQDMANTTQHFFTPEAVKTDWDLECSLAYSSYLQTIMIDRLLEKGISNFEMLVDDQLTVNGEILLKQKREQRKLQDTITNGELLKELVMSVNDLKEKGNKVLNISEANGFGKHIDELIEIFEDASNRLYLKNMKVYENEDHDEFVRCIKKCIETMKMFKKCINFIDHSIKELLLLLKELGNELRESANKQRLVSEQLIRLAVLCFERVSHKFAEIRLNQEN